MRPDGASAMNFGERRVRLRHHEVATLSGSGCAWFEGGVGRESQRRRVQLTHGLAFTAGARSLRPPKVRG